MDLECRSCGAALRVEAHLRTASCPYCSSPSVVDRPARPDQPDPTFALGFSLTQQAAREKVRHWLRRRSFFAPSAVRNASLEDVRGVYLPAWLYSAVARTRFSASIGENYTETYTTTVDGKRVVRSRTVTEWQPLQGTHSDYVADVLVTASKGLSNAELERIEPFDLRLLHRYEPAIISGWIAEDPTLAHDDSLRMAREEASAHVGARIRDFLPGDHQSDVKWDTQFENEGSELVLVPVWVLAARWHAQKPPFRVIVNGQSGAVYGKAPLSAVKITAVVLAVIAIVAAIALFASSGAG